MIGKERWQVARGTALGRLRRRRKVWITKLCKMVKTSRSNGH